MDAIELLKTRRSIRVFAADPVPKELLEDLVDCGRLAATAINIQPWEFVVVTDRESLRRLAETTDHGRFIVGAAACIAVLCKDTKYYLEDGSAATENILLAARAHGLGACWVAGDKKPYADTIRHMLGAPDGFKLVSLIPLGYPAEQPQPFKRALSEVLHWEQFAASGAEPRPQPPKADEEDKRDFQQRMEEQLNQLGRKIDELLAKAEAKAKAEYEKQARNLPPKLQAARRKLDELKTSSGEAWRELKPGLQRAWDEVKKAADAAASKFDREGRP